MKLARRISLALLIVLSTAWSKSDRTVFLISLDGFAGSYLPNASLHQFTKIQSEGSFAKKLTPVFPSLTFPNHLSLATGCPPGKHGVVANQFIDKDRGRFNYTDEPSWLECEPLWVTAERQGVKSAVFHWTMSFRPWNGVEASYHMPVFDPRKSDAKALDTLIEWARLPKKDRPRLLMTYLSGPDHNGHEYGPASGKVQSILEKSDRQIAHFMAKLEKIPDLGPYTVLFVSDHGMAPVKEAVLIDSLFQRYWISGVPLISGPLLYLYLWNPNHAQKVAKDLGKTEGMHIYLPKDLPKEFGPYNPRMGDLIGLLDMPKVYLRGEASESRIPNGAHGYDPRLPSMDGIFIAWGDGIRSNHEFKEANVLDVASTVAKLLDIHPSKQNEGKVIAEILK